MFFFGPAASFFSRLQSWVYFHGKRDDTIENLLYSHLFCSNSHIDPHCA